MPLRPLCPPPQLCRPLSSHHDQLQRPAAGGTPAAPRQQQGRTIFSPMAPRLAAVTSADHFLVRCAMVDSSTGGFSAARFQSSVSSGCCAPRRLRASTTRRNPACCPAARAATAEAQQQRQRRRTRESFLLGLLLPTSTCLRPTSTSTTEHGEACRHRVWP
jgi:hypothetical protein